MKRKLPRWAIYLIGIGISYFVLFVGVLLNGIADSLSLALILVGSTASSLLFLALIVHGIRALVRRATRKHAPVEAALRQQAPARAVRSAAASQPIAAPATAPAADGVFCLGPAAPPLPWWLVILFLLILFPVGIYALIAKTAYEKARYYENGVRLMFLGAIGGVLSLALFILLLIGTTEYSLIFTICMGPGAWALMGLFCFVCGWVLRKKGLENDAYRKLILVDRVTDLNEIARRMNATYAHAIEVIEGLLDRDLLPDAYLYHPDHEVIVPGVSQKIALRCKNCSGTTVLYANEDRVCDYCGGAL